MRRSPSSCRKNWVSVSPSNVRLGIVKGRRKQYTGTPRRHGQVRMSLRKARQPRDPRLEPGWPRAQAARQIRQVRARWRRNDSPRFALAPLAVAVTAQPLREW